MFDGFGVDFFFSRFLFLLRSIAWLLYTVRFHYFFKSLNRLQFECLMLNNIHMLCSFVSLDSFYLFHVKWIKSLANTEVNHDKY